MAKIKLQVTGVIDGDTFVVSPDWQEGDRTGDRVRIANYNAPERGVVGGDAGTRKLQSLIFGKHVELHTQAVDQYGRLVAHVFLNGKNILPRLMAR